MPAGSYERTLNVMFPRFFFPLFLAFVKKNHNRNKYNNSDSDRNPPNNVKTTKYETHNKNNSNNTENFADQRHTIEERIH